MKLKSVVLALAVIMLSAIAFAGCGEEQVQYAIDYYDSTSYDQDGNLIYNENLFYRNEREVDAPDPFVYYNEADGYYYLYGTTSGSVSFETFRSKDLTSWEAMGTVFNATDYDTSVRNAVSQDSWAPELIYDDTLEKYVFFFSATPNSTSAQYLMYAAIGDSPAGPFTLVDFSEEGVGDKSKDVNGVTYTERKDSITVSGIDYTFTDDFARYQYFDPEQFALALEKADPGMFTIYQNSGYIPAIDPHPYVDEDGQKYMYFCLGAGAGTNYLVGMKAGETWLDLDYSSLKLLTMAGYYDVEGNEVNPAEGANNSVNEGPTMTKHNGVYYLTFSVNGYLDRSYSVLQAVSDSPLGPFRKLTEAENGVLLSTDGMAMDLVSGPGHHSFIQRDGEMYIIYHKHNNPEKPTGARHVNVDRIEWVTITDKDGGTLDVMYCNGPTTNLQPLLEFDSEYVNIADKAEISASNLEEGSSTDYLKDGLLSIYKYADQPFIEQYVKETYITGTSTITLNFADYETVRAIMIYNSKDMTAAFREIKRIEFDCVDANGNAVTYFIKDLQFDWKYNKYTDSDELIREGSAAIAEFNEMQCKTIRITIEVPEKGWTFDENGNIIDNLEDYMMFEHENRVGLSEIVVLGARD